MGIINWAVNKHILKIAKSVADSTSAEHNLARHRHPAATEEELLQILFADLCGKATDALTPTEQRLCTKYATTINGFCYFVAWSSDYFGPSLSRQFLIFTEAVDIELAKRGYPEVTYGYKKLWLETMWPGPGMDWGFGLQGGLRDG